MSGLRYGDHVNGAKGRSYRGIVTSDLGPAGRDLERSL